MPYFSGFPKHVIVVLIRRHTRKYHAVDLARQYVHLTVSVCVKLSADVGVEHALDFCPIFTHWHVRGVGFVEFTEPLRGRTPQPPWWGAGELPGNEVSGIPVENGSDCSIFAVR